MLFGSIAPVAHHPAVYKTEQKDPSRVQVADCWPFPQVVPEKISVEKTRQDLHGWSGDCFWGHDQDRMPNCWVVCKKLFFDQSWKRISICKRLIDNKNHPSTHSVAPKHLNVMKRQCSVKCSDEKAFDQSDSKCIAIWKEVASIVESIASCPAHPHPETDEELVLNGRLVLVEASVQIENPQHSSMGEQMRRQRSKLTPVDANKGEDDDIQEPEGQKVVISLIAMVGGLRHLNVLFNS